MDEKIDRLGRLADSLENGLHALRLPGLPAETHIEGMSGIMRHVRDELAAIVREESGIDPWETNPLDG